MGSSYALPVLLGSSSSPATFGMSSIIYGYIKQPSRFTTMELFSQKVPIKLVFLLLILCALSLLNACVTQPTTPSRIPALIYPETSQNAYLWTSGKRNSGFEEVDYATFTKIDGVDVPDKYLPGAGQPPFGSFLLEIPGGKHTVEILYKSGNPAFDVVIILPALFLCVMGGGWGCSFPGVFEKSRQTLGFIAEANHIYASFADDECDRTWYRIEDWGAYVEKSETIGGISNTQSDLTKPVVSGEAPKKNCE